MNVDVVIVAYRSQDHLQRCLDGLPPGVKTIVVDNASGDSGPAIAEKHGATVVENDENLGFAAAANQGAALGKAPFVLFLNPDASPEPGCLEALVRALDEEPTAALAGPRLVLPDGTDQRPWWPFPSARRSWAEAVGLLRLSRPTPGPGNEVPFIVGACLLARRSMFHQLGGFDEAFWLYGEEADLARRMADAGWRAIYVPNATCRHVGGASGEGSDRAFEEFQRGSERFILKHEGRTAMLSHRIALLAGSALRLVLLTLVGRRSAPTARTRARIVRRLFTVIVTHPLSVPPAERLRSNHLVVLSLEPWDEVWRRNQFLVRELLASDPRLRVLYVEPPADVLHDLITRRRLTPHSGLRTSSFSDRVTLFQPRKLLPRALGPLADSFLLRALRSAMVAHGFDGATLWMNDPAYAGVTRWGLPLLYDLTDDWTKADRPPRVQLRLERWDRQLTERADVVVACSPSLADSHSRGNDVRLIPNAVDVDHFTTSQPRPDDLGRSPVAVYVGTLHEDRLDVELVVTVAKALSDLTITLVGPIALAEANQARLAKVPNIQRLGPRPYARVPGYLQHADVLIVPHVVSPFTDSLDPIKAYECLAVGRPTIATPVAGFRNAHDHITVVDRDHFVEAVRAALSDPAPPHEGESVPTWRERGDQFSRALADARSAEAQLSVVYVDHCARLSGGEIALARLIEALDVRAHVILGEDGPLVRRLEAAGATVEVLPLSSVARDVRRGRVQWGALPVRAVMETLRYTIALARRLRERDPDIVHTNSLKAAVYGGLAGRLAGRPVLIHVRDRIAPDYLPAAAVRWVRLLVRILSNSVVANSYTTMNTLHLERRRGSVVASPVVYDAAPLAVQHARQDNDRFTAIMVGRLAPWKGQDVFIDAFALAFPDGTERAIIVGEAMFGEDDFAAQLRAQCQQRGLDGRVELVGFHEDVAPLLATADVVVHASILPEPFGQVVVEGMAAGVPVIASDAGGPAEIITHGENGLLVPPGDVEALAAALRRLESDEELRSRLSRAGRARAEDFAPAVVARQMKAVYRGLTRST